MRISTEPVNQIRQKADRWSNEQKTSDRFSQLLKSKNEKNQEQQVGDREDGDDGRQKSRSSTFDLLSGNPAGTDAAASSLPQSSTAADPGRITQPATIASSQIEKLTAEIGHQIDIFKQGGRLESVNITFDSKTLEGLQVQIRQQDGAMAIHFVTQSDNVSNLLSGHTGELREALTSKGIRIRNIAVSSTHASPVRQRSGHAGV